MAEERKARVKNVKLTGDHKQKFNDRDVTVFDTVMSYAQEINDAVSHSIVTLSGNRLTKLDYLILVTRCAEKHLNSGLLNNFRKMLNGETIGSGSRNMLIVKLAKPFASKEYALSPVGRFFCNSEAWTESLRKKRLTFAMLPKNKAVQKYALPKPIEGIGVLRYDDNAPLIVAEPRPQSELPDDTDPFAIQQAAYDSPDVIKYDDRVSYAIKVCPSGHRYSVNVGSHDEGCFKCAPREKYGTTWKTNHGATPTLTDDSAFARQEVSA